MHHDSCATSAPREAEWLFQDADLSLVAHVPIEGNLWVVVRLDEPGAELSGKSRAVTRALLVHALELLDKAAAEERVNELLGSVRGGESA